LEKDPVKAILQAVYNLAVSRGDSIAGIARAGGQERVKIIVKAFYKHHEEDTGFTLFSEALESLRSEDYDRLEKAGIRLYREKDALYIEVPVSLLGNPEKIREMIND
jgi:hypothetical protein